MRIKIYASDIRIKLRDKLRKIYLRSRNLKEINEKASIICSNCLAGIVMHEYKMRFNTPTINLWIYPSDFIKFCNNLEEYLNCEIVEVKDSGKDYPVGRIKDINVHFLHYSNIKEAIKAWEKRKKRVDLNNIYIVMTERDGCTFEDLKKFDKLPYEKKVVFTAKKYDEIQSSYYVKGFEEQGFVNMLEYKNKIGPFKYYDSFRFDKWLKKDIMVS